MDYKKKVERIFNLQPSSRISGYPFGKVTHINDSYSSLISVLKEYLQEENNEKTPSEETIIKSVEQYFKKANEKLIIFRDEVPRKDLALYYSELISFTNYVIEELNESIKKIPSNTTQIILGIPKMKFYDIIKMQLQEFRNILLNDKNQIELHQATTKHYTIQNGIIYWIGTLSFLAVILDNFLTNNNIIIKKPIDKAKYFLGDKPLINIGSKNIRSLEASFRNVNINSIPDSEKKLINCYIQDFILYDKKRIN